MSQPWSFSSLRNRVEVPDHLAGRGIHRQHVAARDQALAARRADVDDAVVDLRRGGEPVAHRDGGLHVRVAQPQHVEDDAGLAVVAEGLDRLAGLGVEGEDERAGGAVHHAVLVGDAPVTKDVALAPPAAEQVRDVVGPQMMPVVGVDRVDAAPRVGEVHHPVDDHRRGLVADAVDDAVLEQPARGQEVGVLRRDLVGLGVAAAVQIEVVQAPVDVLGRSRERDRHGQRGREQHTAGTDGRHLVDLQSGSIDESKRVNHAGSPGVAQRGGPLRPRRSDLVRGRRSGREARLPRDRPSPETPARYGRTRENARV